MSIILDKDLLQNFQDYLLEGEDILWEGEPMPTAWNSQVSKGTASDDSYLFASIVGWAVFGCYFSIRHGSGLGFGLSVIVGAAALLLPDMYKEKRLKFTKYAFTQRRVFFQLWEWGKLRIHTIDYKEIGQITYEEYEDKSGTIHFLPFKPFDFDTYDFTTGRRRFYPTFEMIPNVIEVQKKLEKCRKER